MAKHVGTNAALWEVLTRAAETIEQDQFAEYFELKRLLASRARRDRQDFRQRFSTYYRLHSAGLTDDFKQRYFELLCSCAPGGDPDPYTPLLLNLYEIARRKGDKTIQASFVSKLVAMHDESRPIFDRHVSGFFGVSVPSVGTTAFRIAGFVANLRRIQEQYEAWASDSRFRRVANLVGQKQPMVAQCHPTRLCDFLVRTVGARRLS